MSNLPPEAHDDDLKPVKTPSGGTFWVYDREVVYFKDRAKRYLEDNHFVNVSDLQDVDRLLVLELMCWRWGIWVSQQKDYWHDPIDESELQKRIKETSVELRQLKSSLGIDKVTRDKQRGEDSISKYIENLKIRAKEFGINRERQLDKALELFQKVSAAVTLFDNCTPEERLEVEIATGYRATESEFIRWLRDEIIPDFEGVDEHFKTNVQKSWVRDM